MKKKKFLLSLSVWNWVDTFYRKASRIFIGPLRREIIHLRRKEEAISRWYLGLVHTVGIVEDPSDGCKGACPQLLFLPWMMMYECWLGTRGSVKGSIVVPCPFAFRTLAPRGKRTWNITAKQRTAFSAHSILLILCLIFFYLISFHCPASK